MKQVGDEVAMNQIMSRRELAAVAAGVATAAAAGEAMAGAEQGPTPQQGNAALRPNADNLPIIRFALLMFPNMTALDLVAPQLIMATMRRTETYLVAEASSPVETDSHLSIVPTHSFATCPADVDVLFVPGGPRGTRDALLNRKLLAFVADRGARAKYVTSVCTGSMILGAAGLLKGYRAASYWGTREFLPLFGATPVDERVVVDRNRITGGGITAGLDFGLRLSAQLRGEATARLQELILEYDPEPPFKGGTLKTARPETSALARQLLGPQMAAIRAAAEQAVKAGPL